MNIKEKIGQRIKMERKAKGLTRKALAELTEDLKQSRINNWERGLRTPGAEEIRLLANALEVAPAYLMCLTDTKQQEANTHIGTLVPLLTHEQACNPKASIQLIKSLENKDDQPFIPISCELAKMVGKHVFALSMNDESMEPELKVNDVLIIDPELSPKPGDFVIAEINHNNEVIVRRFKQLTVTKTSSQFELMATNNHWGSLQITDGLHCELLGTVVGLNRILKKSY